MSKGFKVVFVAFTLHCIQSTVTHVTHVKRVKSILCIQWPPTPQKGKAICYMQCYVERVERNTLEYN